MKNNVSDYLVKDFSSLVIFELSDLIVRKTDGFYASELRNFSLFLKNGGIGFSCDQIENGIYSKRKTIILPLKQRHKFELLNFNLPLCVMSLTVEDYNNFLKNVTLKRAYKVAQLSYISFKRFEKLDDIPRCRPFYDIWNH